MMMMMNEIASPISEEEPNAKNKTAFQSKTDNRKYLLLERKELFFSAKP
jgi:hypothetical protein|tara:strand:+ start:2539 stop:2685 length:147 start_codon:yes stop_codon:yes gene_type:complete